jgi:RNA polymerase sigma-70 factor (ECF subfamily)
MREDGSAPLDFNAIYRDYGRVVARWATRLGGPSVAVDDIVQEVFLVVSRRLGGFRAEAKLSTWLFRITRQTVRNVRRRHRRRWSWISRLTKRVENSVPADRPSPHDDRERNEAIAEFYRLLDALPEKYREAIVLHELEGMDAQQIGELLGVKVPTVRVRLHRARAAFLAGIDAEGPLGKAERS